jgi:DNA-binding transcriptional LysR family regulator
MDRFEAMTVLLAVVETGSLSAAGRKLSMPLPTVSRKVSDLESHLKAQLLTRSTRRLVLTEAGRAFVEASRRILEDLGEAERLVRGEYSAPKGELVITAPIVFGRLHMVPIVAAFLKAYPEVNVRLLLGDRTINLLEEHVDLAVRIGELPDSSLIATRVGVLGRVVCGSPAYFAAFGTPDHPADLRGHQCVMFDALQPRNAWTFRIEGRDVEVPVRARLRVNTAEAAIDAAVAGVGLTRVLSYQIEAARKAGLLEVVLAGYAREPIPISLVYTSQGRLPLKLRAFIDFAAPRLRRTLVEIAQAGELFGQRP